MKIVKNKRKLSKTKEKNMTTGKIRIGAKQGVPLVREMILDIAVVAELGESCPWITRKERRDNISAKNIEKLNTAIDGIAQKLSQVSITYSTDRQAVIDQIKEKLQPVRLKYIYEKHLEHNTEWWTYRTRKADRNGFAYSLTEEEVLKINLAIADIVARLRRIELVAE